MYLQTGSATEYTRQNRFKTTEGLATNEKKKVLYKYLSLAQENEDGVETDTSGLETDKASATGKRKGNWQEHRRDSPLL